MSWAMCYPVKKVRVKWLLQWDNGVQVLEAEVMIEVSSDVKIEQELYPSRQLPNKKDLYVNGLCSLLD